MTATIAPSSRRSGRWLPTLTLLVAGGAAALGVVAIATDDVSDQPAPFVVDRPAPIPAAVDEPAAVRQGPTPIACGDRARPVMPCYE